MTRFASVDPLVGQGTELTVIAAAVIGGTSLRGGFGSVIGAAFGVLTFGMIQVGAAVGERARLLLPRRRRRNLARRDDRPDLYVEGL